MTSRSELKYVIQAKRALEIYLNRGQLALKEIRYGKTDKAEKTLRMQKAAWFNFVAAFDLISDVHQKNSIESYVNENFDEILRIQETEKQVLSLECEKIQRQIGDLRKNKNHMSKYKRQQSQVTRVEQFI